MNYDGTTGKIAAVVVAVERAQLLPLVLQLLVVPPFVQRERERERDKLGRRSRARLSGAQLAAHRDILK